MNTIEEELRKNGISNICHINDRAKNAIATYVASSLCNRFPELRLNFNTIGISITKLTMYVADMGQNSVGASYFYKNSSIYFKRGLPFEKIKKLAVHECIHHFQEIKDAKGELHRLGLCSYAGNKAYGNALNEAAVQLMASYANNDTPEIVTYYGITMPADSSSYYPLLCNLIKQLGYLTDFQTLFESTFFSNDAFFEKFKAAVGENNAFTIQKNFEKILQTENRINEINAKIQTEDLPYKKFKKATNAGEKGKQTIQKMFLGTQNLIITSYFDARINKLKTITEIEEYRKHLYSFINLIGTTETYTFFNDYYIQKMAELDVKYEKIVKNVSLTVVKKNKISMFFDAIKKLLGIKQKEKQKQNL